MDTFHDFFQKNPIIAILRGIKPDEVLDVCEILHKNDINLVAIALSAPQAFESIEKAAKEFHDGRMFIGAGTVLSTDEVRTVANIGGKFIFSPNCNCEVIRVTKLEQLISIPGFFTPTEAFSALSAGADYLKLFPASSFDFTYIRRLEDIIKSSVIAIGGVDGSNIADYLKNCSGVCIGSAIYTQGDSLATVEQKVKLIKEGISKK